MGTSLHWSATFPALLGFWLHGAALASHVQRVPPRALLILVARTGWRSRGGVGVRDTRGTAVLQVASTINPPGEMGASFHWSATLHALLDFWLHRAALASHVQRGPPRALLAASRDRHSGGGCRCSGGGCFSKEPASVCIVCLSDITFGQTLSLSRQGVVLWRNRVEIIAIIDCMIRVSQSPARIVHHAVEIIRSISNLRICSLRQMC